jgi:hypothetical protein
MKREDNTQKDNTQKDNTQKDNIKKTIQLDENKKRKWCVGEQGKNVEQKDFVVQLSKKRF